MRIWQQLDNVVRRKIWDENIEALPGWQARLTRAARLLYLVVRDLLDGQLSLRAMSLVYTSMLSLVPLLAVTFSVLKAFGVHNQIQPLLDGLLVPLGPTGAEISSRVIGFVDNIEVGVLGSIGLALLFFFVVSLVQKIEADLNFIWKIRRPRGLAQRFSEYISVLLVGPVLIFAALSVTASISSNALGVEAISTVFKWVGRLLPYLLVCAAFTFFYIFIPNKRVRFVSALTGGIVAAVLWQTVGWAFASFVASSAKYAAIYSGFAVLVLFMIWLYVSWYILLVGAQVAYYHQHPRKSPAHIGDQPLSGALKERLALLVMYLVGYNHYHHKPAWNVDALAVHTGLAIEPVETVVDNLVDIGLLVQTGDDPPAYVPAKDIDTVSLKSVLVGIRDTGAKAYGGDDLQHSVPALNAVLRELDQVVSERLGARTLKSLVLADTEDAHLVMTAAAGVSDAKRRSSS
jgi:membrane protein